MSDFFYLDPAKCTIPPPGWSCTRVPGHDGPCAAWPTMTKHVFSKGPDPKLLRIEEARPECGEHFCDACGDCLAHDSYCVLSGTDLHVWVEYEEAVR